jgi:CBS domain-containing protein
MAIDRIMTSKPATCTPQATLAEAARIMWDDDCGCVPVTDPDGRLLGIVTDRDICIATATRDRSPGQISVGDVIAEQEVLVACRPEAGPRAALALMRQHQVRRVPVTTEDGMLVGVVSINDFILESGSGDVKTADVMAALRAICAHRQALTTT